MQETHGRSAEFVRGFNTALSEHSEFIRNNSADRMQANMERLLKTEGVRDVTADSHHSGPAMPRIEGGGPLSDNMRKLLTDPKTLAGSGV